MKFTRLEIPDLILCEPKIFLDTRGSFTESFRLDKICQFTGEPLSFCQDNLSYSRHAVLRGLHYQSNPFAQSKLVTVISGEVLDVAVDIRKGSPSFGKYVSVKLNGENRKSLLIPRGFAHGFVVLSEHAVFSYKVDNYYNSTSDRGIIYDDKDLKIDWQIKPCDLVVSEKDQQHPSFRDAEHFG